MLEHIHNERDPKVLIVGQPFNKNSGGGITLCNLFNGWNKNSLAVACTGYLLQDSIDTDICDNYYQLGHLEHSWIFPFHFIKRKYPSGPIFFEKNIRMADLSFKKSSIRVKLIMNLLVPLLEYLGIIHFVSKLRISDQFNTWLREYDPDVIYFQASSLPDIKFCLSIIDQLNNRKRCYAFHMMDDWPSVVIHQGILGKYWHRRIDRKLRELFDKCSLLLSIGESMTDVYLQRYSKKFVPFHNPIDVALWSSHQRMEYALSKEPQILYAGRIGLGIDTSLIVFSKALDLVNRRLGTNVKLTLRTARNPSWTEKFPCVEHKPFVPYEELPRIFASADFLLIPYDFSEKSIGYIKYSIPTKASEYMASGTPIVIFAPEETAITKYAIRDNWALIATENDHEILADKLEYFLLNQSKRQSVASKAKILVGLRHDQAIVATDFQNLLKRSIENEICAPV